MAEQEPKKTTARKTTKPAAKKTTTRKPAAKKPPAKTTARKPVAKKASPKKTTTKKATTPKTKPTPTNVPPNPAEQEWTPPKRPVDPAHPAELFKDILFCLAFFTRLPIPVNDDIRSRDMAKACWAFPIAGIAIGCIAGLALMAAAALHMHPLFCGFVAVAVAALVTGALHEDGLADVADGFGGGTTKERKLEIMRDSRIGTYGVLTLILLTGFKVTALAGLMGPGLAAGTIIAAHAFSRGLMPMVMMLMDPARKDGLGASAGKPDLPRFATAAGLGVVVVLMAMTPSVAAVSLIMAPMAAAVIAGLALHQIGGQTGDVLGAQQQASEVAIYVTAAALAV